MTHKKYNSQEIDLLRRRAENATRHHGDVMFRSFEAYEEKPGTPFISKENFEKILGSSIPPNSEYSFDHDQIMGLLDYVCAISLAGLVNYKHFLGLGNVKYQELDNN